MHQLPVLDFDHVPDHHRHRVHELPSPHYKLPLKTEHLVARIFVSVLRTFDFSHAHACGSSLGCVCTSARLKSSTLTACFHRPLLDVPDPCPSFCSTPPPTAPTSLPMAGSGALPVPLRTEDCSLAVRPNHFLTQVMSPKLSSTSAVGTRRSTTPPTEAASTTSPQQSQPPKPLI